MLSFAYVYFLESGLFNGLQPIQIKKILVPSQVVCRRSEQALPPNLPRFFFSFSGPGPAGRPRSTVEFVIAGIIGSASALRKKLSSTNRAHNISQVCLGVMENQNRSGAERVRPDCVTLPRGRPEQAASDGVAAGRVVIPAQPENLESRQSLAECPLSRA